MGISFIIPTLIFARQFSKAYLHESNFQGADFTNGIVDRASFFKSDLRQAIFHNAVLTGTNFEGANVEGADFSDAYIGDFDIRNLCKVRTTCMYYTYSPHLLPSPNRTPLSLEPTRRLVWIRRTP